MTRISSQMSRAALPALMLLLAALLSGCLGHPAAKTPDPVDASGNDQRMAYLAELGWEADPEPLEALVLQLPTELGETYGDYLKLQEQQGLPFSQCGGKTVSRYTYSVTNYPNYDGPVQIDLWVCGGVLVGGDVTAPGENGFQDGLAFPQEAARQ